MGKTPINVYFIKKQTPKQSLQADQSLLPTAKEFGISFMLLVAFR